MGGGVPDTGNDAAVTVDNPFRSAARQTSPLLAHNSWIEADGVALQQLGTVQDKTNTEEKEEAPHSIAKLRLHLPPDRFL